MRSSFPRPIGSLIPIWCSPATAGRSSLPAAKAMASSSRPTQLDAAITPRTRWLLHQFAEQPDRRQLHRGGVSRARRCAGAPSACDGHDGRHLRAHPLRRQAHAAPAVGRARAARPHPGHQRCLEDLCHDRLAYRLGRRSERPDRGTRHAAVAVGRQLLRDQPGGGRRCAERRPGIRRRKCHNL